MAAETPSDAEAFVEDKEPGDAPVAPAPVDNRVALNISDACGLVSKIITMNRIALESMRTELNFNKKIAEFRLHENRVVRAKMALIEQLNNVFELQLHEFTDERQRQTADLYRQINEHDENKKSKELVDEIRRLEDIKSALQNQFMQLDAQIPDRRLIVNYKIRPPKSKDQSCSEAAQNYVGEAEIELEED